MDLEGFYKEESQLIRLRSHTAAVRTYWNSVVAIKEAIANDDLPYVAQLWLEIPKDQHTRLYSMSTRDGGLWTTRERAAIRQAEMLTWQEEGRV